jgi:hypothetical protein
VGGLGVGAAVGMAVFTTVGIGVLGAVEMVGALNTARLRCQSCCWIDSLHCWPWCRRLIIVGLAGIKPPSRE